MSTDRQSVGLGPAADWYQVQTGAAITYACGYCGDKVASASGYQCNEGGTGAVVAFIRICPGCKRPTFFPVSGDRCPGTAPGRPVAELPDDLSKLYEEARQSAAAQAPTAAVMVCRKILMNIAVSKGAQHGESFVSYVDYLANQGYIPPSGKSWVDYIRTKGNEANHEIALMIPQDATSLITFVEMLLKFIYEFPSLVPPPAVSP